MEKTFADHFKIDSQSKEKKPFYPPTILMFLLDLEKPKRFYHTRLQEYLAGERETFTISTAQLSEALERWFEYNSNAPYPGLDPFLRQLEDLAWVNAKKATYQAPDPPCTLSKTQLRFNWTWQKIKASL